MRSWSRSFALLLVVVILASGCLSAPIDDEDDEAPAETQEVWFDAVMGPDEALEVIERLDGFDGVQVQEIGTSLEGRPLHTVSVGEGPFVLWVTARLHGNEPTGMQASLLILRLLADPDATLPADAPAILHDLAAHRERLLDLLTFVFVPVGNPDGAAAYTRGNSAGVDLNRDFFAFSQGESQVIRDAFWSHRPDGCLDLHNIGNSENDFEAYGPEGPLLEANMEALMLQDAARAVHELDAQGARASGFNEDYRAPEPLETHPWPEVYHPGTHDFFCTSRGAPGWTPEGSIPGGDNGDTDPRFAWSARLHAVTVATSAFGWAGAYDGIVPQVSKTAASGNATTAMQVEIREEQAGSKALFQAVWRPVAGYGDHSLQPVILRVSGGAEDEETVITPGPYQWTSTVLIEDVQPGTYEIEVDSVVPMQHELRAYVRAPADPLVDVARTGDTINVAAHEDAPGTVRVTLTDVADAGAWENATLSPPPDAVHELEGSVHDRSVAQWTLDLEPGAAMNITVTGLADERPGPYRFTATSGDRLYMGHDTEPRVADD